MTAGRSRSIRTPVSSAVRRSSIRLVDTNCSITSCPGYSNTSGHLMIHAGAVRTPHGVIIFVGDTGAGKSSLAASFQPPASRSCPTTVCASIVDDDGAVECVPTYRSLRLWPDSAEALAGDEPFEPMSADSDKRRLQLVRNVDAAGDERRCHLRARVRRTRPGHGDTLAASTGPCRVAAARTVLPSRPDRCRLRRERTFDAVRRPGRASPGGGAQLPP